MRVPAVPLRSDRSQGRSLAGFTLVELMVVIAVVAILAAIAYPSYSNYLLRAKVRVAQGDLVALSANVENHRQRTLWYPTVDGDPAATFKGWAPSSDPEDFAFHVKGTQAAYSATASWRGDGPLRGCVLTISSGTPARAATRECSAAGDIGW